VYKNYGEDTQVAVAVFKPGDFFGEMSLFLNEPRSATVAAHEDIIALEINRINAYGFLEKQPAATYSMFRTLCTRIMILTDKLAGSGPPIIAPEQTPAFDKTPALAADSKLFPQGHKLYDESVYKAPGNPGILASKDFQCPICMCTFRKKTPRTQMLVTDRMDEDTRIHYRGIEHLYYNVITCPVCRMSAFDDLFEKAMSARERQLNELISLYKSEFYFSGETPESIQEVFAGYYFALLCSPLCFTASASLMANAQLWQGISWLYADCGDTEMEKYAMVQACEAYAKAYTKGSVPADWTQRVNLIMGELYFRQRDWENARLFLSEARKDQSGPVYARMADSRLDEIKAVLAK
jgi:hypothetical protein